MIWNQGPGAVQAPHQHLTDAGCGCALDWVRWYSPGATSVCLVSSMKLAIPLAEELNNLSRYNWKACPLSRYLTSAAAFGAWSKKSELTLHSIHQKRGCCLGTDPTASPEQAVRELKALGFSPCDSTDSAVGVRTLQVHEGHTFCHGLGMAFSSLILLLKPCCCLLSLPLQLKAQKAKITGWDKNDLLETPMG